VTSGVTSRVRWGLPDAALVWVAGAIAATIAVIPAYSGDRDGPSPLYSFGIALPAQQFAMLAALVAVSRYKGRGTLKDDFGFEVQRRHLKALWWGVGLQFAFTVLVAPLAWLSREDDPQALLEDLEESRGPAAVALFVFGAVIMAPIVEELLYRGLLLRSLMRRVSPPWSVVISGLIFGCVHLVGDPGIIELVPALTGLGIILGVIAVRTNSLSLPILIHAGFNLTTSIIFVAFEAS
jgi:membrane protease YdiL (CAAX protease family)